jgi:predicted DCC family thiol-disulfide oxidoreductase YuxK
MPESAGTPPPTGAARRVLYDGECGVCRALAAQARRRDTGRRLVLLPYQTQRSSDLAPNVSTKDLEDALHVILEDGSVRRRAEAVVAVLDVLPPPWNWLARLGSWRPFRSVADVLYGQFARHRRLVSRLLRLGGGS